MQNLYQPIASPPDALQFAWRHKGKMLVVSLAILGGTLAYLSLAGRMYESQAKLYVRLGRESVTLDPTATTRQTVAIEDSRENEINAINELLASRLLAAAVVDDIGVEVILGRDKKRAKNPMKEAIKKALKTLEPYNLNPLQVFSYRDKAIGHLQESLRLLAAKKTSVISLSYESDDPQLAQRVLESLIEHGREEHLRVNRTQGSHDFFETQAKLLNAQLVEQENALRALKDSTGLASFTQQREIHLTRIGMLEDELVKAQADLQAKQAEVDSRQKLVASLPELIVAEQVTGQPNTPEFNMRQRLFELEIQEEELLAKVTPENPRVVQIRKQLAEARQIIGDESLKTQVTKATNKARETADVALHERRAEIAALSARTGTLNSQIAAAKSEVQTLNENEIKLARLEREIELATLNYRKYAENLEQARIDHELDQAQISSINVMQPPSYSETPTKPRMLVVLAVGFVLAMGSSIGVALLAEHYRRPQVVLVQTTPASVRSASRTLAAEPELEDEEVDSAREPALAGASSTSRSSRLERSAANPR